MRDAIGGTMLMWIVVFFMALFMSFMAVVIQYSRVYKIKNNSIEDIERSEGICSIEKLEELLNRNKYYGKYIICYNPAKMNFSNINNGAANDSIGGYYSLTLYARFAFSNFGFDMPVQGETRIIETGVCDGINIVTGSNSYAYTEGNRQYTCKTGDSSKM